MSSIQLSFSSTEKNDFSLAKPKLRGFFHQAAFFFSLGACGMLLSLAKNFNSLISVFIYSFGVVTLFGVSSLYHRRQWSPKNRQWMRRLDHAAIFIMIAGTGTPLCLLAISETGGKTLLVLIWGAAFLGVMQTLFWIKAPKYLSAILYLAMGWLAAPYISELKVALGNLSVSLVVIGGVIYSIGAVVYALKRPNPWPLIFGYHEIFHILTIVAAILHFIVIARLIY